MAKKLDDIEHGMELQVIKSYRKDIDSENIIVWGDLGWLCREYTNIFAVGDTFIFNLHQLGESTVDSYERPNDFSLSVCGRHYLHVKNGQVIGRITKSDEMVTQAIDLSTFDKAIMIEDCTSLDVSTITVFPTLTDESESQPLIATISPNPFIDNLNITSSHKNYLVEVFDMTGRLITNINSDSNFYSIKFSELKLTSGMYLIRIIGNREEVNVKCSMPISGLSIHNSRR